MNGNQTKKYINIGKCIGIIAVILDHTNSIIFETIDISILTYFSVSLFVLFSGITTYYSCQRHYEQLGVIETLRKINAIFLPYLIATAAYQLVNERTLNFNQFYHNLINFNASPPMYFVLFYIQLIIVAPFLFSIINIINTKNHAYHIAAIMICCIIAAISIRYTEFPGIGGGGKYFLGATYLILFYIGMAFASLHIQLKTLKPAGALTLISLLGVAGWGIYLLNNQFILDSLFPFGDGKNPPGVSLMIYALAMGILIYSSCTLIELIDNPLLNLLENIVSFFGRYSLAIFLYHMMVKDIIMARSDDMVERWYGKLFLLAAMFLVPIICHYIYLKLKNIYKTLANRAMENGRKAR